MARNSLALLRRVWNASLCLAALSAGVFSTGSAWAQIPQTIVFTQPASPVGYTLGMTIPLSVTGGGSGNPVVLKLDASSTGTGTFTGNTLNVGSVGTFVIDANQAGATNYLVAPQVQRTVQVVAFQSQTIAFTPPATPVAYTSGLTITLLASGGSSGNPVVFNVDGTSTGTGTIVSNHLTVTGVGSLVIDANQAGNATYSAATQVQKSIQVNPGAQTISFSALTSPVTYSAGLTIPLSATGGASGNPVVFTIDAGSTGAGSIAGGNLHVTGAGAFIIDANQAGNSFYAAATQVQREVDVESGTSQAVLSPQAENFGSVVIGESSPIETVVLKNTGTSSFTINGISVSPSPYANTGTGTCAVGHSLSMNAVCSIVLSANNPTTLGALVPGQLTVITTATNADVSIPLSEYGVLPTTLSHADFPLGNVVLGQTSTPYTATLTNYQAVPVNISSIAFPAGEGYAFGAGNTCPNPGQLAEKHSCVISVTFTPAVLGPAAAGSLTIMSDAPNSPMSVPITGTGIAAIKLSPSPLNFGTVADGTSVTVNLLVTNAWSQTLTFTGATVPAPFFIDTSASPANKCTLIGGNLSGTLAGGGSCNLPIKFSPTAPGIVSGKSITISSNDPAGAAKATLTGAGTPATSIFPTSEAFNNVVLNSVVTKVLQFTSSQSVSLSFTSITAPSPYAVISGVNSCAVATPVIAGGTCNIYVTYTPTTAGSTPASNLTVMDNAAAGPTTLTVPLTGNGVVSTVFSPTTFNFGDVAINTTSLTKAFTITNNTLNVLQLNGTVFNGPFALDTTSSIPGGCPLVGGALNGTLAANTTCFLGVTFKPTALGAIAGGKITILDNDPSGPLSASLTGTGIAPTTLLPSPVAFGNVAENTTSAAQQVTLANNLGTPLTLSSITAPSPFAVTNGANACSTSTPVPAMGSCFIYVRYSPTGLGAAPATMLTVKDNASSGPTTLTDNLTGTGTTAVTVSPATLLFGSVTIGESATEYETIVNNQPVSLSINSITGFPSGYTQGTAPSKNCGTTLNPGAWCELAVVLTPTTAGMQPGTIAVNDNAPGSPQTFNVNGLALLQAQAYPRSLVFPAQFVGTTSSPMTTTLTNELGTPLTINSASITGTNPNDFAVTTTCPTAPSTFPGHASCNFSVTFTPTASGTRTANLTIADTALNTPQTVILVGSGEAPVLVTPGALTTFTAPVGSTSPYQTVTIKNAQTASTVNISNLILSGDFIQSATNCGASLPYTLTAGASCTVQIEFDPTIGGTRTGQLQVYDNTGTSPQVVNLSGTGTSPLTIAPTLLSFSAQQVNTSSAAKLITLTNHEVQAETFSLGTTGDYSATSNCPTGVIAAQSTCKLFVTFSPSSVTPSTRSGNLAITHSAAVGSPINASLTGSAISTPPQASVAVVSPGAGSAGATVNVVITGNGWTHFSNTSTISFVDTDSASYPADITVQSFTAISANQINATLVLGTPSTNSGYGARNITVTSPLSGGGTETASLLSAFIIADPTLSHQITQVTPEQGIQGQTLNVSLVATGTHFVQGVTFANFGDGITVDSLDILSATTANTTITISNTTPVGYRTVTMVTGGEYAVSVLRPDNNPIFYIGPNSATLVTVSPNSEPQGFSGTITLTATGTHFLQNATQVSIGGVIVGDVNVQSPTVAVAQVAVPASAPLGTQNVTVSTGGEIAGLNNAFTITGSTPALVSVAPSSAQQGQSTTVVITGNAYTAFNACPGGVLIADLSGEISSPAVNVVNAHQVSIPITVAENAAVGSINANLTCGGAGSATIFPFSFSVTPSNAQIVSVVPNSIPQGGQVQVTVTGLNTDWVQGTTTAQFYPVPVPAPTVPEVTIHSPTSAVLNIAVPTNTPPGNYGFYMATGGQVVSAAINVYPNTPTLTMNPANGLVPTNGITNSFTVNFTGQFTHWSAATVPVIAGEGVTLTGFTVNNKVSATATLNIAPGSATGLRLVTFTTGAEIVTTYFNVTSTPVGIISINPWHGPQNTTISNIEIVGLNTHWVSGTTQVLFGPQITVNSFTVTDNTHLTANITTSYKNLGVTTPTPSGYQAVYVNTGAEQVITGFAVDPPATPTITSVSPNSAQQGSTDTPVTITGNLTNWVQGQSELILGAGVTVANLQIISPIEATATISVSPTAPVGGNSVIMITGTEIDSGTGFSVTPSAALIQSVEPNFTCSENFTIADFNCSAGNPPTGVPVVAQLQTVQLNIVGVGTHWLQGETSISFGPGVNIDVLTVTDPTHIKTQITVLSSAPVGFAALTTFTDGEAVTLQQAIDIEEGSPILLAISPGAGQQAATFTMQLLGRFTHFQQGVTQVTFNNNPDLSVVPGSINVIDSENLTVGITVSPLAYVDIPDPYCGHEVVVTTGSEQVFTNPPTLNNFCVQQGAEEITKVSPLSGFQGTTMVVTITGSATNFEAGVTQVSFGDSNFKVGQITVNSLTSLTVPVGISTSATTGYKQVTVTTLGQVATQQFSFTVTPGVAQLVEAISNQAEQGAPLSGQPPLVVRLIGQYSHFSGLSTAVLGPGITVQSVAYISPTEVDATINIDPLSYVGGRTVTVTTPGVSCADQPPSDYNGGGVTYQGCTPGSSAGTGKEIVTANVFSIIPGPAIITGINPATGNEGQEVAFNISGLDTHWQQNFTQFYIAGGGSDITVNSVVINSATSATVDITISPTANPGSRSIYMVTNGESLTDSGAFVVTGGIPVVTSVSPNNGLQGTIGLGVTIYGNAYTQWNSTSKIGFGPGIAINSFQVDDASHIEAVLNIASNAQIGYRTVTVQTGTQVLTGYFQVTAPAPPPTPYIWYENPSSGIPGQTMTINFVGAYTHWDPNPITGTQLTGFDSYVSVNSFQVTSPTTALANISISPTAVGKTYDLTLTTDTVNPAEVDTAGFSVVVAQPTLSVVDPGSAIQGAQNVTVNIIGQFTQFDATTTFSFGTGGITVNGPPTILGPTIATQSISVGIETPTGGYPVVSTTTDAPAGQIVVGGAAFYVTPSLAMISAITPNTALQGQIIQVEVTGQNTHWAGNTVFQFGAGIVVTSTTVNTATDATLQLAIPPLATEGPTDVTATTGGEVARINNGFVVQAGTPLLLSSGPGSLPQQSSAIFTILSQATNWSNATPPAVSFGAGVVVTNVNVTSATSLTASGFVQPTTPVGYRDLTVTTGTQLLTLPNAFYVTPGPAVINTVNPNSAGQGTTLNVTVYGTNTNWQQGVTTLSFPGATVNTLTVNAAAVMTANITISDYAAAGQVTLTATTVGEVATGVNVFTITQTQPEILGVVSASGTQGQTETVTITGAFTHFSTANSVANFGAGVTVNSVNALSATSLQANITVSPTATLGYRNVSVTTGTEVVNLNNAFQVTVGPAAIQSLSPNTGAEGNSYTITVTGSQTHFASGVTTATFGGGINVTGISVTDLLHAKVNISIPATTPIGQYNVTLTTGGEAATILGGFNVAVGSPQISQVQPPTGHQGDTNSDITLTGLFTHWVNGTSTASFGAGITVNTLTVSNSGSAIANITISPSATLGSRNVTVTTGAEVATITGGFTVLAGVPALVSAVPGTAQAGSSSDNIVITGAFTTFQQGFSTVTMGAGVTINFVTVSSLTQLTANITVASNATVGPRDITVTTSGQVVTLSGGLMVTAGTPVITQINPNFGNPGQSNLNVTINGQYTNWVNGTTVATFGGGITVNTTTVSNATSLVANISIPSGASLGPVDVKTTTGGEVEDVPGGFTIQAATIPAPSLLSISPGVNAGGVPINTVVTAVFSQPMNRTTITTSTFEMWLVSNPGSWVPVPGTVSVDASGRVATFTPTTLLAVNSQYYLLLTNGIKDATGNTFSQYGYVSLYTIDSADTTPVTVIAANPPANSTNIGTNVAIQVEFSANMNQETAALTPSGLVVSTGGNPVPGTYSWNANVNCCSWGPGTVLTFTPTSPLQAGTMYTVSWNSPLADTAGNAVTPGSFTFTTGAGADTAQNYTGPDFTNYLGVVGANQPGSNLPPPGLNFAPRVNFAKPINPIDINTGTLLLYNADSGKYVQGTVTVAPNGMSAKFTPQYPLLPNTFYHLHQAWGSGWDADGNYLNGVDAYFSTGTETGGTEPTPQVTTISPAKNATSVPLNSVIIATFNTPVDPDSINNSTVSITPNGGGAAITGTASLQSDMVTLIFTPNTSSISLATGLQPGKQYNVQISGFSDVEGNAGTTFNSTFTTATSPVVINVSTGVDSSGHVILTGNTVDPHWTYYPTSGTSGETGFKYPGTQPLKVVASNDSDWYGGWAANGPNSSWIAINPNSAQSNSFGFYSTPFTLPNPLPSGHLCLVGGMSHDDNGLLAVNGTAIMSDQGYTGGALTPLNIDITSLVTTGTNYLTFGFGSTDNNLEGLRVQAVVEVCGASVINSLYLTAATPSYAATGVATNTSITLTFNNNLDPATVNSTTLPVMVNWNSNQELEGNYVVTGNQVVFTPNSPFPTSTTIWIGAFNGPYDMAGDSAATCGGNCYTQLTYFTTGSTATTDSTPFHVVAFSPANNATNISLRTPVSATFDRSVNLNSANANDFALFAGDGQSPWCVNQSHSQDDETIVFNCYPLPSSTPMTAYLGSGLSDWQGYQLTPPVTFQFTTTYYDSNTNGTITASRPGNAVSGISTGEPITLYLNLPVDPATASSGIEVAQNNQAVPGSVQVLDNGYVLVFTPSSPWGQGALIQWWTTGSLINATYETPYNGASGYFFVAGSTATLAPAVQVVSPASGSTAPTNAIVDVLFNTPLNASTVNSTNLYLYDSSTGLHVGGTYSMPNPNEVKIVPTSALSPNAVMYLYLTTGLQSATSVPVPNQTYVYFYTGPSADNTVPTVVSAVPYNGATNVGINVAPGAVFSKTIDPVSVNSSTFQVLQGANPLPGYFWFNGGDTRVEFVPNEALPANATLSLKINGVVDLEGHTINFASSFLTGNGPDFSQPYVVSTSIPVNNSVPTNTTINVQFSTSMDVTTFGAGQPGACSDFYIYDTLAEQCIATTLQWNSTQTAANLTPSAPLAAGREYYLYINSGTDIAGNQIGYIEQTFYAELSSASTAPTVLYFNPLPNATGVGTNVIIEAEFTAPIDPTTTGNVTLTQGANTIPTTQAFGAGNTVIELVPAVPLAPNTAYKMNINGVKDPAGNALASTSNSFTTGTTYDLTAPTATDSEPGYNTTVGTNVIPKLVFNKPLNPITVTNNTFRMYVYDNNQWIPLAVTPSTDGFTVTMVPQIALVPGTRYHFQGCCGFQDEDGNNGSQIDEYFWTSGGAVTTGPVFCVPTPSVPCAGEAFQVSPVNNATGVPLNTQVIITLSAPIDPTSVSQNAIQVFNPGNNAVAGTVSVVNVQEIAFTPAANLTAATVYTVKVNHFTDANGNAVTPYTSTFTTGSTATTLNGLTVTSSNPIAGTSNVSESQVITLNFNQPLDPNTVNGSTLSVMDNWNSSYQIAGTWSMVTSTQIQFTPANAYPPGATIFVGSCPGPTDLFGEVLYGGGCYPQQITYFVVNSASPDTTPLTVKSISPAKGTTNVSQDSSVSVTFNKAINTGSVNSNDALLFAGQGLQDRGGITMSNDGQTLTFNAGQLYANATYTVELPAGGISDYSGNTLASNYTATFTTGSNAPTGNGSVVGNNPGNNASGVPTNTLLTLFVNRPVNPSTLAGNLNVAVNGVVYPGTLQALADGYEIQYTPTNPFPAGATVQWFFGGMYDIYGDSINGTSDVFYTAPAVNAATAAPNLVSVSPACCNSQLVPTNGHVDIQYSLPIDSTTLAGNIYQNTGPSAAFTLSLVSPTVVRISPPAGGWNPSTQYGFCTNTLVKGTNGVAAPNYCWLTYFTTTASSDSTAGTLTVGPPNNATNVGTNAYLRFQFSKPMDRSTINPTNIVIKSGSNVIPGTWSYNYSNADLYGANFSPLNALPASSTISIVTSGLEDYAGNTFASTSTSFGAGAMPDYSQPTVQLNFGGNTSGIGTNASFTCLYSEAMDPSSITTGNTYLYSYVTNASVPVTYKWATDLMAVTLTPKQPLFVDTEYQFYCQGGIDLTGNGQQNNSSYFYTGGGPGPSGPQLVQANPPGGMTNVPLNNIGGPWGSSVMLQFNEPVAADTLANVTLTPQGGSPLPIATYAEWGNTIAIVDLPWALSANTLYTFNVAGVMDLNGNPAQPPTTSSFTTGSTFDWNTPAVSSALPDSGAKSVALTGATISVTFNEVMNPVLIDANHVYLVTHNSQTTVPGTMTITNNFTAGTTTVTITPSALLAGSTIYDLVVTNPNWCMIDVAGNNMNNCGGQVVTTFTTAAATPINGACGPANGKTFASVAAVNPADLCSAGTVSGQTNNGTYSWMCNGLNAGTNAPCSATITPANACYAQSNLPANSIKGWWKGDDSAADHTANANNGTLENGAGYGLGEINDAFSLNGSNQYVLIGQPVPTALQIQNDITLQAWIYPTAYPSINSGGYWGLIVGSQEDTHTTGASIFYNGNNNITDVPIGSITLNLGDGSHWYTTGTTTQVPLNQWTLVTATRTANNPAQIYYNGVAQPTTTWNTAAWPGTVSYTGAWFAIGQQQDYNRPFTGLIDEVQVFNTALTQTQIQAIYTAGNAGVCP